MRSAERRARRPTPAMNVTPLVDVVLVLLIIFMVVAPMLENDVRVDIPSIFNIDPESHGRSDPITVSIAHDGQLFLEKERLDRAGLETRLRDLHARAPNRRVVLRGDRDVHYQEARAVFALCQTVGFPGVSFRVGQRSDVAPSPPPSPHSGRGGLTSN